MMVMLFHISENMKDYFQFNLLGISYLPISGGVNYFFALSGFMLYYIYRGKIGDSNHIKGFLLSRFIRIYPLYWVLTLVAVPVLFLFPSLGTGQAITFKSIIFSLLLFPNELDPILDVAWSLVHTVYFYWIFSFLFFRSVKLSKLILAFWGITSLGFFMGIFWSNHKMMYFFFNQYNLIFLAGILSAYLITRYKFNFKMSVILTVIGMLGFPLTWLNYVYKVVNIDFDLGTGLSSILIIFGLASIDIQKNIKIPRVFNYLGNAAFAIYLSHNLFLNAFSELFSRFSIFESIGGALTSISFLVLILCTGCLVHSFIEKPLISKMKWMIPKNNTAVTKVNGAENPSSLNVS